ncbi:MAG: GNAT family N-acetyltransferase [Firmicutes bacterium]|nr:GNAT family N-acetyltransferase [Bacillota bacterium]
MDLPLNIVQILTFIVVGASALASTILFFKTKNKDREKETFDYIDDKFTDFLEICLAKPYLDIFDVEDDNKIELNDMQKKEEKIAFAYLMGIFERVYIFYVDNGRKCDTDQFVNWKRTIQEYLKRDNFRDAWVENGYGWDAGFILFMDDLFLKIESKVELEAVRSRTQLEMWYKEYKDQFVIDANNDKFERLVSYFEYEGKYPYQYYFIKDCNGTIVGGLLTQEIKNAVVILYIFVKEKYRKQGLGSFALRKLRTQYKEKNFFLAEVEKRNEEHKPWWINNLFAEIKIDYYTPEMNHDTHSEIKAVNVNDLVTFYNKPVAPKHLLKIINIYFKTSFVYDEHLNINHFEAVKNNTEQLLNMKKELDFRIKRIVNK